VSIGVSLGLMKLTDSFVPLLLYMAIVLSDLMHCLSFFNVFVDAIVLFCVFVLGLAVYNT